ncbi:hypothetical protein Ddye_016857 [Dipteronia dyeriana]|uniref:Protein FAR1-RELATED SEQUENCE n=1 Tax=Dipteronia dyeriana TaxID=168575 RepID=A0AAD9X0G1_9ROSI|nr:hypothetical protein Ddye_016857 [Dipteronia dyeriana]
MDEDLKLTDTSNMKEWPFHVTYAPGGFVRKKDIDQRKMSKGTITSGSSNSNADLIIPYMTAKAEMGPGLFFRYIILKDSSTGNLFWFDAMSRCDYRYFRDVISFDSTYRTNAYNRPLHLEQNVQTNVGDTWFTKAFTHCMFTYMSEIEFGTQWLKAIKTFGLQNKEWVNSLYGKRTLWAETFLRKTFFSGLRSTQRSKSINSFLNRFLYNRLKLYKFMSHIDRAMLRLRNNEMKDDFDIINEHPVLVTHLLQLEKHDAEVFARNIFQWVRDKIKLEAKLSIVNCVDDMESVVYTFKKFGGGDKAWNVSVMKATNQQHIHETLIMQWWTMIAKDGSELESSSATTTPNIMEIGRY